MLLFNMNNTDKIGTGFISPEITRKQLNNHPFRYTIHLFQVRYQLPFFQVEEGKCQHISCILYILYFELLHYIFNPVLPLLCVLPCFQPAMHRTRRTLGSARLPLSDLPSQRGAASPKCLFGGFCMVWTCDRSALRRCALSLTQPFHC